MSSQGFSRGGVSVPLYIMMAICINHVPCRMTNMARVRERTGLFGKAPSARMVAAQPTMVYTSSLWMIT